MSDDERPITYKVSTLKGADHYAEWELSIASALLAKDLLEYTVKTRPFFDNPSAAQKKDLIRFGKAWAIIIQSLSPVVQSSLSTAARSTSAPNPQLLWDKLKSQYSPSGGSCLAALLHNIWATPIQEGEDPNPHMARI